MNKHIKVIDGRKYYYSSIRKKGKPTSKYIAPVKKIYTTKNKVEVCKK